MNALRLRPSPGFALSLGFVTSLLAASAPPPATAAAQEPATVSSAPASTPPAGPSWISILRRPFDRTALGRIGALGPKEQDSELSAPPPPDGRWLREGFEVRGADVFRYTCRACHGAAGVGSPPEILPLVERVRDTSWTLQARQGLAGAEGRTDSAREVLKHRISAGGPAMPPFDHLSEAESEILLAYLERLAALPDPEHVDAPIRMPVDRVGEQIVKGTCQICHDTRTTTGRPAAVAIPALDRMTATIPAGQFAARARHRGSAGLHGKGPEVTYLRDVELEAAYFYLAAYPPR